MSKSKERIFDVSLFKRLFVFTKPYRFVFYSLLITVFVLALLSVASPYILSEAVDKKITAQVSEGFLDYIILMISLLLFEVILQFLFVYYSTWLGQSLIKDIRDKLFRHMLNFKMTYFDNSSVGILMTRAVTDMERIGSVFGEALFVISRDLVVMAAILGFMFYKNWQLGLIVIISLPLVLYATKLFQKYMKKAFEIVRTEVSNLNSFVQERVTGMKILQLFTREAIEYENFKVINERHKKAWIQTVWYNSIFFPISEFLSSITLGLVVWFGGLNVVLGDMTTAGDLFAFIYVTPKLFRPLRHIADKFNTVQMGMVAASRVFKVIDTTSQIDDTGTEIMNNVKGHITLNNVTFSYVENEPVLKGVSLKVESGETIAIVGATGAGKSTIVNLLNRFYEINSGSITIDGKPITNYTLNSLRKNIAIVLQDVFLFADTIFNNITLKNPEITLPQVKEAAKSIGVHDFIMSLPNDYNFNVKERGVMLSSGQRQLISFLRAYIIAPSILVLDEATSSVDSHAEQLIQQATDKITEGRTSIVIAHRLATVKKADRIVVMDSGKIVEQGSHKELLDIKDGYYNRLYNVQFMKEVKH